MEIQSTLYLLLVFNRPFPATLSLFFIVLRYIKNRKILFIKLSITGFELGSSGVGSDRCDQIGRFLYFGQPFQAFGNN